MKWGVFIAAAAFEEDDSETAREVAILGWWVAGDIPAVGDLPFDGTASYSGGAVGTVADQILFDAIGRTTYVATGDMDMKWDFGKRSGDLKISKFDQAHFGNDGLTFRGKMCAPGVSGCGTTTPKGNHFGGKLTGQLPGNGQAGGLPRRTRDSNGIALGSFARGPGNYDPETGNPSRAAHPQGVMGNWGVGNDHYQASGIFAGKRNRPTEAIGRVPSRSAETCRR